MTSLLYVLTTPITYVEVALVLFLSIFISVLVRECIRPNQEVLRMSCLPMESDTGTAAKEAAQ